MGLLMYGYKEAEERRKDTSRKDPTATSRSAIRRQQTVRRRDNPVTERRNGRASPRSVRLSLSNYVVDDRDGEFVIAPRPRPNVNSWSSDSRRTYRDEVEEHLRLRRAEDRIARRSLDPPTLLREQSQASNHREPTRESTREATRITTRNPRNPTVRESYLRNEIRHDDEIDMIERAIMERAAAIDQPSQDWIERTRQYWAERGDRAARRASPGPAQSERLAPAFRFDRSDEERATAAQPVWARRAEQGRPRNEEYNRTMTGRHDGPADGEHDTTMDLGEASRVSTPAALSPNFPPLERTIARQSTPRHGMVIDGLGDRRRSPSPGQSSGPGDDAWETLITTITNDERLPSTESSFTSATASASFSELQSGSSATSPSLTNAIDSGVHRDRDCDEPGAGIQTPDSLPDLIPASRSPSFSVRPDHVQGEGEPPSLAQSFEEARQELQRDIEVYSRSRMQRLLGSFLSRGERVPEELWQAFVPRNILDGVADAADLGMTDVGNGARVES